MPKHYHIGENYRHGEVSLSGTKKKKVKFAKPFNTIPGVSFTLGDASSQPPFKLTVAKDHFWIRFTNKYRGIVSWSAREMD